MKSPSCFPAGWFALCGLLLSAVPTPANLPGGGTGTGPNVTYVDNGNGTVTMANGIVTAVIGSSSSQILQLTCNGQQVTDGGTGGTSAFYWQGTAQNGAEQTGAGGILSVLADPANNGGNSAEISIANLYANQSTTNAYAADAYYYFCMFRGSPGIYVAEVMNRTTNFPAGAADIPSFTCKLGTNFNWLAQDNGRNMLRESLADANSATAGINNAPKEVTLLNQGVLAGQFECKYDYSGDLGLLNFVGWCSTGLATNFGLWLIHPSREYFSCGPKHPEIIGQFDMINCTFKGVHFGFGSDLQFTNGETWSRVCGPMLLYFNQVPPGTPNAQAPLYADVFAQAAAERSAWPYSWLTDTNYAAESGRGTVAGTMVIADPGNPNASAAGLWVGVLQQPPSSLDPPTTDFQNFSKNYQFWVKSDANGNFFIPNVVAGANYTLLAFGPGAIGLFQSQSFGTAPPVALFIPPAPFSITVAAGQTNSLGDIIWTPPRVGATVWEIGVPDRDTTEFRHGADYWHGDLGSATNFPVNWGQWQDYNLDFPTGVNYTVGQSRWSADWDYAQPTSLDPTTGDLNPTTQNIFFNLQDSPATNAQASLYFAIAGDYSGPVIVTVNGVNVTSPSTGFFPAYSDDPMIRMESHGIFCDYRLNFAGNVLQQGQNEIQLNMRKGGYFSDSILYDYLRLELTGYIPPAPAALTALPGNGLVVLDWPASSGATSYNVRRSTTSGSGYSTIVTNVTGPVVGSDVPDATYTDNSVVNDTPYYYVVQAVNPNGTSADTVQAEATPSAATPSAPAAPTGLTLTPGNMQVALNWNASPGAATYAIQRTVITAGAVANDPGAEVSTNPDGSAPTNTVNSFVTGTNYTDTGLANGVVYSYVVSAANANGQSAASAAVAATTSPVFPLPPTNLAATVSSNLINLSWNPVTNASTYLLQRASSISGPFTNVDAPAWLTVFTDGPLPYDTTYYYQVASANLAGISTNSAPLAVTTGPAAPAAIIAVPGNAQVSLNWSPSAGATNYVLESSTTSGGPYTTTNSTADTNFVNTGLVNGITYYYVVYAVSPSGQSSISPEAGATPLLGLAGAYWISTVTASPQNWNANANWNTLTAFPNLINATAVINNGITANQTINLNQSITVGSLDIGAPGGSYNIALNGGAFTLNNTPGIASLVQLSVSQGDTIFAPMQVNGGLIVTNTSSNTFALSGDISGATNGITVIGGVTFNGTNTYSGGLVIPTNSTVLTGNTNASLRAWGTGAITFMGGSLQFFGYAGSGGTDWGGCSNTFTVPAGQTGTLLLPPRFGYSTPFASALTGSGTLNVTVDYVRDFFTGNWSAFTGQINVSPRSGTGDFRINNSSGYANAAIYLNSGVNLYNINASGQTTDLGELGGASGAFIGAGSEASIYPTWRIGAKNTTNTYAGIIADSGVTALIKIGTGTLVLSGPNTYSGGTTVSAGLLLVNNSTGSGTGSGAVTVASGATLGGAGLMAGPATVKSGGTLAPGNPMGALTFANSLTLAGGSTTLLAVSHAPLTNSAAVVLGALTNGGTLLITNLGATQLEGGDTFALFSATNYSGAFASVVLPPLQPALAWNTNLLNTAGKVSVVVTTQPLFKPLASSARGLIFTGAGGVPKATYYLLGSSNIAAPLSNWVPVFTNLFDASGNFDFTNPASPNQPREFYLLELP
jgi:autotransporter-associated beta strand protein